MVKSYKDLEVWQRSMDLVVEIYRLTEKLPARETYALSDQIRRAAVSIPSNIAEGSGRNTTKEFIQFVYMSLGSACEVETQLLILEKVGYFPHHHLNDTLEEINTIKRMLNGLINALKKKATTNTTTNTNTTTTTNTNTKTQNRSKP